MRKFLFVLASTGRLATMNAAIAQYPATRYPTPLVTTAPGYTAPGYMSREQRLNDERRTTPNCVSSTKTKDR